MRRLGSVGIAIGAAALLAVLACERSASPQDVFDDAGPEALRDGALAFSAAFLEMLDRGAFEESWDAAAETMQQRAGREAWLDGVRGARETLGAFRTRSLLRYGYRGDLADAPPGDYFVVEYESEFSQSAVVERVVCFHQRGREWRAAGYFATTK